MPVGHYGNGFKSGSMRLGTDALVFTKSTKSRSVGFLSQTYLDMVKADSIIVPIVTWNMSNGGIFSIEFCVMCYIFSIEFCVLCYIFSIEFCVLCYHMSSNHHNLSLN